MRMSKCIYFMPVRTSTCRLEKKMALKLEMSVVARGHAQLSNLRHTMTHLTVPIGGNN